MGKSTNLAQVARDGILQVANVKLSVSGLNVQAAQANHAYLTRLNAE